MKKLPPLTQETTLWRGTSHFPYGQPGQAYEDPAFTSTTSDTGMAKTRFGGGQAGCFLMQITAPPAASCRDISDLTGNKKEREFLFPPQTVFAIDSLIQGDEQNSTLVTLRPL